MTVVSALILGKEIDKKNSGELFIADERVTGGPIPHRVSDIAPEKLFQIDDCYCLGASGSVSILYQTLEKLKTDMKQTEPKKASDIEQLIIKCNRYALDRVAEELVLNPNHVTWEELKSGAIKDEMFKGKVMSELDRFNRDLSRTGFIAGGKLKEDNEYRLSAIYGTKGMGSPYYSIGAGAEGADVVIRSYLQRMKREDRKSIPLTLGTRILLESTQAAWGDEGVGGAGQIVHLNKEGYHELDTDEIKLLHSLIYSEKIGMLKKDETNMYISDVMAGTKAE